MFTPGEEELNVKIKIQRNRKEKGGRVKKWRRNERETDTIEEQEIPMTLNLYVAYDNSQRSDSRSRGEPLYRTGERGRRKCQIKRRAAGRDLVTCCHSERRKEKNKNRIKRKHFPQTRVIYWVYFRSKATECIVSEYNQK